MNARVGLLHRLRRRRSHDWKPLAAISLRSCSQPRPAFEKPWPSHLALAVHEGERSMTARVLTESPPARRLARLLAGVRDALAALLSPGFALPRQVVDMMARRRARAPQRLAAGSQAGPATGVPPSSNIAARREPSFTTIRVEPTFGPRAYAATFASLQESQSAKLLDLVSARLLSADVFERLAKAWTAAPESVPRLGILLSFERWVMLREAAVAALQPLAARGVRIEVFYVEQARYVPEWFAHGQVVHNVPAAITALAARWEPSATWPAVIKRLRWLIGMYATLDEQPALLVDIAGMALSCGGAEQAAILAHEAICYLPLDPTATRSQALRELGVALLSQGQTAAGLRLLDQAIATAAAAKTPAVGASALCQSGLYALNHGDYAVAERRFRDAVDLLSSTPRRHLLALAHHSLAVALMHQGKGEAEHHATAALALRSDVDSHLAEEDRVLLSRLREGRREAN